MDNTTSKTPVAATKRLSTHCIVLGGDRSDWNAAGSLERQIEPVDAVSVIESCQMPAINAALANAKSDLIFFLRCGESWTDAFVARIRAVYQNRPEADVVCCDWTSATTETEPNDAESAVIDLGFSAVATYAGLDYDAHPLSCFVIRRRIVERILPLADDPDWQDQPHAVLAIAASLASARKFYLSHCLVRSDFERKQNNHADLATRLKIMRLVGKTANQLGLSSDFVKQFLVTEYSSCRKDPKTIANYCRLLQAYHPNTRSRRQILLSMYRNMKEHLRGNGSLDANLRRWWLKQTLRWTGKLAV